MEHTSSKPATLFREARACINARRYEEAASLLEHMVAGGYDRPDCRLELARTHVALSHYDRASRLLHQLLMTHPAPALYHELGLIELNLLQNEGAAREHFIKAIELDASFVSGYHGVARSSILSCHPEQEAIRHLSKTSVRFDSALLDSCVAESLADVGRFEDAKAICEDVIKRNRSCTNALSALARIEFDLGNVGRAGSLHREAVDLGKAPAVIQRYIQYLCAIGDYPLAGRIFRSANQWYRYRNAMCVEPYSKPELAGEPVSGKTVLLRTDTMGYGDIIQFIRFARLLKNRGATVYVHCPDRIRSLISSCGYIDLASSSLKSLPPYDREEHLLTLWLALGVDLDQIKICSHQFAIPSTSVESWRARLGKPNALKVGLNWRGSSVLSANRYSAVYRSLPVESFAPLAHCTKARFFSVQFGISREEKQSATDNLGCTSLHLGEFEDVAAALAAVDIVLTSDTAIAHLAAALGKPTVVVLPFCAEWRWMRNRSDSPFYPSIRLSRQRTPGDWRGAVNDAAAILATFHTS